MAAEVIWSDAAQADRKAILSYWKIRNGNSTYSTKLLTRFNSAVANLIAFPYLGRPSDHPGVRVFPVGEYLIFYRSAPEGILILHVWDGRRDLSAMEF